MPKQLAQFVYYPFLLLFVLIHIHEQKIRFITTTWVEREIFNRQKVFMQYMCIEKANSSFIKRVLPKAFLDRKKIRIILTYTHILTNNFKREIQVHYKLPKFKYSEKN